MEDLVLGFDIGDEASHVSFYDSTKKMPETIAFENGESYLKNPVSLREIFACAGEPERVAGMRGLLGLLISEARKQCRKTTVDRLCITTDEYKEDRLDVIRKACIQLDGDMDRIEFISHEESLAFYAFNLHRDMWCNGIVFMDYSAKGLTTRRLERIKLKGQEMVATTAADDDGSERLLDAVKVADRLQGLNAVEDLLLESARKVMDDRATSSVYLTGQGFDTTDIPKKFLQYICNRHRVFAGQNLYALGACKAAAGGFASDLLLVCGNRLAATVDMDIVERGKNMLFRVAQAGTNWYQARRQVDFIADGCDRMTLHVHPVGQQMDRDEVVEFSGFPYREGKTTRITVSFGFKGDEAMEVVVEDKGFGDLVESSGKSVSRTISIN